MEQRPRRARDLGIAPGRYQPGPANSIGYRGNTRYAVPHRFVLDRCPAAGALGQI